MTFSINTFAIYVEKMPYSIVQPDGTKIDCFITGDEFGGMIHDKNGFSLLKNEKDSWWYYAENINDKAVCSKYIVGKVNPDEKGLKKGIHSFDKEFFDSVTKHRKENIGKFSVSGGILKSASTTTSSVTIQTLVIFVRFNGMSEFYQNRDYYSPLFNSTSGQSLKSYFLESSYNQLDVSSTFYPTCASNTNLSYMDTNDRSYYLRNSTNGYGDNVTERTAREHGLIKRAVEAIASQVPSNLNLDVNNDGNVDHVCIITQGGLADISSGTSDILWPHRWALFSQDAYINGKKVNDYTLLNTSIELTAKTICHEFFHVLGASDLYHGPDNNSTLYPASYWGIMGDGHSNIFPHMDAYSKNRYGGWIASIPEITQPGTYTLSPLTSSSNNCYKIKSQYSPDEYFIVEYRKRSGIYENTLGGDGLLVYRIYENGDNYYGPNDEAYIYRPNGTLTADGNPQSANYSSSVGRTSINDTTNPTSFLKNGTSGGLRISNISSSGTAISFTLDFNIYISGASLVCSSGTTYSIVNPPPGATVSWSCTSTNNDLAISPTTGYAYATSSTPGQGTISAVIHASYGDITLPAKTVWVGAPVITSISGPTSTPNNQWATYTAQLESGLSAPSGYSWTLNPLNGNSVYNYGSTVDIAFYKSGSYQLVVQAKNTCSGTGYGPYYVTGIYVYDAQRLSITPNPATGETTLKLVSENNDAPVALTEWDYEIYDSMQSLKEKKTKLKTAEAKISTSGWKDGVYIVRAVIGDKIITEKLMVKH